MFEKLRKITHQIITSQLVSPTGYDSLQESQLQLMRKTLNEFGNEPTLTPEFAKRYFANNPVKNFYLGRNPDEALIMVKASTKDLDIRETMYEVIKIYKSVINDKLAIVFKNKCGENIYNTIKDPRKVNKEFNLRTEPMEKIHNNLYSMGITLEIEKAEETKKEFFTLFQAAYILRESPRTINILKTNRRSKLHSIAEEDKENFTEDKTTGMLQFSEKGLKIIYECLSEETKISEEELTKNLEKFKKEKVYGIAEISKLKNINNEKLKRKAKELLSQNNDAIINEPFMQGILGIKESYIDQILEMTSKKETYKKTEYQEPPKEFTLEDAYKKIIEAAPSFAQADMENNIGTHYAEITRRYYGLDFNRPFKFKDMEFIFERENGKTYLSYNGERKDTNDLNISLSIILKGLQPKDIIFSKFCPKEGQEYYTYNFFEKKIIKKIKGEDKMFDAMAEKIGLVFSEQELKNLSEEDIMNRIKAN